MLRGTLCQQAMHRTADPLQPSSAAPHYARLLVMLARWLGAQPLADRQNWTAGRAGAKPPPHCRWMRQDWTAGRVGAKLPSRTREIRTVGQAASLAVRRRRRLVGRPARGGQLASGQSGLDLARRVGWPRFGRGGSSAGRRVRTQQQIACRGAGEPTARCRELWSAASCGRPLSRPL